MKKDNMLNESTIRRFMKLATIGGLSDKFVDEKLQESDDVEEGMRPSKRDDEKEMREGDDDVEEGMRADKHDDEKGMREGDDDIEEGKHEDDEKMEESEEELTFEEEDLEERGLSMQMDRDDDMDMGEPEAAAGGMVSVDQLMAALEKALEDVLGQEVEVSQDDDEVDMDMDLDMDAPDAGDELGLDADAEEEGEEEEEELEEATPKTDVVEEVYARVIQRLTQETKSNKK